MNNNRDMAIFCNPIGFIFLIPYLIVAGVIWIAFQIYQEVQLNKSLREKAQRSVEIDRN